MRVKWGWMAGRSHASHNAAGVPRPCATDPIHSTLPVFDTSEGTCRRTSSSRLNAKKRESGKAMREASEKKEERKVG